MSVDMSNHYGQMPSSIGTSDGSVLVIYTDDGPSGPCGQSMKTTCEHTRVYRFSSESRFRGFVGSKSLIDVFGRKGKKAKVSIVVIGEWSTGYFEFTDCG